MIRKSSQLIALMLIAAPAALCAQTPNIPDVSQSGVLQMDSQLAQHRAALLNQCPTLDRYEGDAVKLPIHVEEWGTSGPHVLIIHGGVQGGLGGGPSSFAEQKSLAKQGWHLLLPERPGFGESPSRGPDDQAKDAIWIARMLVDGTNLIGHSWGGADALLAAATRPDAIYSLILVEPALDQLLHTDTKFRDDPRVKQAVSVPALMLSADTPSSFAIGFARSLGAPKEGNPGPNAPARALEANPEAAAKFGCALLRAKPAPNAMLLQAVETLKNAKVPVLVITGGWSPSIEATGELVAELTGGRHLTVPSPNHFIMSSNPEGFNNAVVMFMRQAATRRGASERHFP